MEKEGLLSCLYKILVLCADGHIFARAQLKIRFLSSMYAILIHIYYPDSWERIFKAHLIRLKEQGPVLMVNLTKSTKNAHTIAAIKNDFPESYILTTPNKGKDIGGKLVLIDLFLKTRQEVEYIVLLHDKVSPHAITGDRWRNKLLNIIEPETIKSILKDFKKDAKTGVIGTADFVTSEYNEEQKTLETTNVFKLQELVKTFGLSVTDYTFIAGTMFWIRSSIIKNFFSNYTPLRCREMLEAGDFTDQYEGTYTHSWERIFCWLATSAQYKVRGI